MDFARSKKVKFSKINWNSSLFFKIFEINFDTFYKNLLIYKIDKNFINISCLLTWVSIFEN